MVWEAADRLCSERLKAALPHLVESMGRHGHLDLTTPQGLLMSFLPVGEGTLPTINRPSHRPPPGLHHGQYPRTLSKIRRAGSDG